MTQPKNQPVDEIRAINLQFINGEIGVEEANDKIDRIAQLSTPPKKEQPNE